MQSDHKTLQNYLHGELHGADESPEPDDKSHCVAGKMEKLNSDAAQSDVHKS